MGKLDVKLNKDGGKLIVEMQGVIDEDADFSQIKISDSQTVELRMEALKSINSCGIREWIKWVGTAAEAQIVYSKCPKVIVDQINMVEGFLPSNAKVESFFVPYYNDDSGSEKNILFSHGKEFTDSGVTPPSAVKDEEGNDMEMDVIEAKYFKFIQK